MNNSRPPNSMNASPASFPPLNNQASKVNLTSPELGQSVIDHTLQTLSTLVGEPGVILKDVKDTSNPNGPIKDTLFVPMKDILGHNLVVDKPPTANNSTGEQMLASLTPTSTTSNHVLPTAQSNLCNQQLPQRTDSPADYAVTISYSGHGQPCPIAPCSNVFLQRF